jgi:hypothetical protein
MNNFEKNEKIGNDRSDKSKIQPSISTRITRLQPKNSRIKLNKRYKLVIQWNHKYNNPKLSNLTIINMIGYLARGPRESRSSCSWIMILLLLGFLLHRRDNCPVEACDTRAAGIGEGGRSTITIRERLRESENVFFREAAKEEAERLRTWDD